MGTVHPFQQPPRRPPPPADDWTRRVLTKQNRQGIDEVISCKANAVTILRNDPEWQDVLAFNDLSQGIVCRYPPPWHDDDAPSGAPASWAKAWTESDGDRAQNWLQRSRWQLTVSEATAYRAALMVAEARRFNPLTEWLDGLEWDGIPRVDRLLHLYFGCEDTPYTRLVSRIFAVGSIDRAYQPGCKFDTMLVLEGIQDLGKSTGLRALYGADYFRESPIDLRSNDRFLAMQGCWCREWPELDGHGKADERRVKSFLSAQVDDFRAPYGRTMVHIPRACVLAATVNPPQLGYLVDETGNRRMLPVMCGVTGTIDIEGLERDRAVIWAEARDMAREGAKRYPATRAEKALCNGEQQQRMEADAWSGRVGAWLAAQKPGAEVTIKEILGGPLDLPVRDWDRKNQTRAGVCLSRCGWTVVRRDGAEPRERYYGKREMPVPPETIDPDDVERTGIQEEPPGAVAAE
jgi:putative DNA primase/helicase